MENERSGGIAGRLGRLLVRGPNTKVATCAVALAAASGVGLSAAFAAPSHGGWATVGMAGVAVGLAAGLASVVPALAAVYLRRERLVSIAAASLSFGASAYLVARSLKSGAGAGVSSG
jgi:hypothetical protein